ncbi:hypothetical protein [Nocardioides limicola]|uniref:hypothetical protein n=1 Tax=Nocardioides limicola TaxID=2803368 RepID=UPI00193C76D6|nr:hypothetical protein [Nocardioides sp. DJM-14]
MTLTKQLLDAQVAWILDQVLGDRLAETVAADVDRVLAIAGDLPLADLVDVDQVAPVVRRLVAGVPSTVAADALVRRTVEILYAGPEERFSADQVLARDQVEALVGEVLQGSRLAEKALDDLARSPLMATVASRFVGRLVGEVLQANRAVADKVPGLGQLMSFGTSAASMVMGAADKQFEALIGGASGKGATFAARRLNKILLETLQDPTTRAAVMEVWDMFADKPLPLPSEHVAEEDVLRFAGVLHEAVATAAASGPAGDLVEALVAGFFHVYGEHPLATLLEELEVTRDDLIEDLTAVVGTTAAALHRAGVLEDAIRSRLAPFWSSDEVAALLER